MRLTTSIQYFIYDTKGPLPTTLYTFKEAADFACSHSKTVKGEVIVVRIDSDKPSKYSQVMFTYVNGIRV